MKKVGLVTFHKHNYGSELQCFATKTFVRKLGYECDLIVEKNIGFDLLAQKCKSYLSLIFTAIIHPTFVKKYLVYRKSAYPISNIEPDALKKLMLFSESVLQPRECSRPLLKQLGKDRSYTAFISGSDQIWNSSVIFRPFYFLDFSKEIKKIAFACSFGADFVADYNVKRVKQALRSYSSLSVREETGKTIVKSMIDNDVARVADPTVLIDASEWRSFSAQGKGLILSEKYILLHFISRPSNVALQFISKLQADNCCKLIVFSYTHPDYEIFDNIEIVSGSPYDYVSLIDNAFCVCTDSYHSSLFSINLHTDFYVFEREYGSAHKQSGRLQTLISTYKCESRLVKSQNQLTHDIHWNSIEHILMRERETARNYLINALEKEVATTTIKNEADCTGCCACADVCLHGAIQMVTGKDGANVAHVDMTKCVGCGLCTNICSQQKVKRNELSENSFYLAYCTDTNLRHAAASGGVFACIARYIIEKGGVVYGARMIIKNGKPELHHVEVTTINDLSYILGSKYVQSDCTGIYKRVKERLREGRTVLFSGTSCQVQALYAFLAGSNTSKLYTVDFVCHGVPGDKVLQNYCEYIERKKRVHIKDIKFRVKKDNGEIKYGMCFSGNDRKGVIDIFIPQRRSSYMRMFMNKDSYRENCYYCENASVNKPSDITLGDYFEARDDFPELFNDSKLEKIYDLSLIVSHNNRGNDIFKNVAAELEYIPIDGTTAQLSHPQLCKPGFPTSKRTTLMKKALDERSYAGIERYYCLHDAALSIPIKLKHLIKDVTK